MIYNTHVTGFLAGDNGAREAKEFKQNYIEMPPNEKDVSANESTPALSKTFSSHESFISVENHQFVWGRKLKELLDMGTYLHRASNPA